MRRLRATDIKFLKGVGPKRAELLAKEAGIRTYYDLLHYFPSHYADRTQVYAIRNFGGEMPSVQVKGRFVTFNVVGEGAKRRLVGLFTDGSATMEVVWFRNINKMREAFQPGREYVLFGKPACYGATWSMAHPEIDPADSLTASEGLRGVYPLTERLRNAGFSSKTFFTLANTLLSSRRDIEDPFPPEIIRRLKLMPLSEALNAIHNPQTPAQINRARERLKFNELFLLQLNILRYSSNRRRQSGGFRFVHIGRYFHRFYDECLP